MNIQKTLNNALLPLSNFFKKNNRIINMSLIILLLGIILPMEEFFKFNLHGLIKDKSDQLMKMPFFMATLSLIIYTIYVSKDPMMFSLVMIIIYTLMSSKGGNKEVDSEN